MGNFLRGYKEVPVKWPDRLDKTLTRLPSNKEKIEAMEAEIKELRKFRLKLLKVVEHYQAKSFDWYKKARSLDQTLKEKDKKARSFNQTLKEKDKKNPERMAVVEQPSSLTRWIGGNPFH